VIASWKTSGARRPRASDPTTKKSEIITETMIDVADFLARTHLKQIER
jgi:hypothetical protein